MTIDGVHVCLEIGLGMGLGGLWLVIVEGRTQFTCMRMCLFGIFGTSQVLMIVVMFDKLFVSLVS